MSTMHIKTDLPREYEINLAPNVEVVLKPTLDATYEGDIITWYEITITYSVTMGDEVHEQVMCALLDDCGDYVRDIKPFEISDELFPAFKSWAERAFEQYKKEILQ